MRNGAKTLILILLFASVCAAQKPEFKKIENRAFKTGEKLTFDVKYGFVTAGVAEFAIPKIVKISGRDAYNVTFKVSSVPTFDAFAYSLAGILAEGSEFVIARNVNVDELYCSRYAVAGGSYKTVTPLDIIKKSGFEAYIKKDDLIFGNYGVKSDMHKTDTDALSIAKWSLKFGKPLLTEDFDYLEPDYLKKFEGRKLK